MPKQKPKEIIIDSSSLILLTKTSLLNSLLKLKTKLIIPNAVFEEVIIKGITSGHQDALILEKLANQKKFKVENPPPSYIKKLIQSFSLHYGENESIALAWHKKEALTFCDDKRAITACKVLNLKFLTVANFLEELYFKKIINKKQATLNLNKLEIYGWYSPEIINQLKNKINGTKTS